MTDATRRSTLLGLGAVGLAAQDAHAGPVPKAVKRHRGFRAWKEVRNPVAAPLDGQVATVDGRITSLRSWIGPGPSVLILWALWCPPCMAEKPALATLHRRLTQMKSNTRLRCLQIYDDRSLADGQATLQRMRCGDLEIARGSPALERSFVEIFGASPVDRRRTSMPSVLLLDDRGVELGRAQAALELLPRPYWSDPKTVEFLAGLDRLIAQG